MILNGIKTHTPVNSKHKCCYKFLTITTTTTTKHCYHFFPLLCPSQQLPVKYPIEKMTSTSQNQLSVCCCGGGGGKGPHFSNSTSRT